MTPQRFRFVNVPLVLVFCLFSFTWLTAAWATDGTLDPSFSSAGGVRQIPIIRGRVDYTDGTGRYLLYGYFTSINGEAHSSIAWFSSGGSLDSAFNPQVNGER